MKRSPMRRTRWLVIIALLMACESPPHFAVGQCFEVVVSDTGSSVDPWDKPFPTDVTIYRVMEIGKQSYRVQYWNEKRSDWNDLSFGLKFWVYDGRRVVECPR